MRTPQNRLIVWAVALVTLLVAGCGGGGGNGTPVAALTSISVTPANPSLPVGVLTQFKAVGTYSDGTSKDITSNVTWSSATPSVAAIGVGSGLSNALAAGFSAITASSGSVSGSATLTVTATVLQAIAVTPTNPSSVVPQGTQFSAAGTYSDGTSYDITQAVTWSSGSPPVASIVATSGAATAIAAGTSIITAKLGSISGNTTLTVAPAALLTIGVTPVNPSISVPQSIQLTATGHYSDGSNRDISSFVTWTSAIGSVASITSNGVTAALAPGATVITAALGSVSGITTVTVTPAVLQSISVTPGNPSVQVGLSQQFTAAGSYSDGTFNDITASVTWSSGNTSVAKFISAGLASGVSAGVATITASLGGVTGSTNLTVNAVVLQSLTVTPTSPSIVVGGAQQFTATGTYSDASTHDLTTSATWSSNNTSVATVNSAGLVSGVSAGLTTIAAKSGTVSGNATLTVSAPVVDAVTPTAITLGSAGSCTGGTLTTTFHVAAASGLTWKVAGDPNTPPLGGAPLGLVPGSSGGSGSFVVTITVPPQLPSSSFSSCKLTYSLATFNNVFVTFSDGTIIGVTVYWTFIGTT